MDRTVWENGLPDYANSTGTIRKYGIYNQQSIDKMILSKCVTN